MVRICAKKIEKTSKIPLKSDKMKSEHVQASACHFCFIEVITKMKKKSIRCPYCGGTAVLRDASYVYGGESGHKHLYVCQHYPECNAYVGVHEGTLIPLGTLADRELRNKRIRAHQTFDRIWKNGILTKKNAYRWMQDIFCLTEQQAHIGCFSGYMCDRLIEESRRVLQNHEQREGVRCG